MSEPDFKLAVVAEALLLWSCGAKFPLAVVVP